MSATRMKARWDGVTALAAIVGIVVLEIVALSNGINGTFFSVSLVAIAGLGGYGLSSALNKLGGTQS